MEPIKPKQYLDDEHVADFRSATEHRATWMYLLVDEARKRGLTPNLPGTPSTAADASTGPKSPRRTA